MKKRVILFSGIGIILLLAIIFKVNKSKIDKAYVENYNATFPEEYISENYPNAKIVSNHSEGDNLFTARCEQYLCYDTEKQFAFTQEFVYQGKPSKLIAYNDNSGGYNAMIKHREAFDRCIESIPEYYGGEFFTRYNPDNISGILVFAQLKDIDSLTELIDGLKRSAQNERSVNDCYVSYSIYFCSDELYNILENFDYESIVYSEKYMYLFSGQLGIEAAELMSGKQFFVTGSYSIDYFSNRVPSDTDILFIKGEPNSTKLIVELYSEL